MSNLEPGYKLPGYVSLPGPPERIEDFQDWYEHFRKRVEEMYQSLTERIEHLNMVSELADMEAYADPSAFSAEDSPSIVARGQRQMLHLSDTMESFVDASVGDKASPEVVTHEWFPVDTLRGMETTDASGIATIVFRATKPHPANAAGTTQRTFKNAIAGGPYHPIVHVSMQVSGFTPPDWATHWIDSFTVSGGAGSSFTGIIVHAAGYKAATGSYQAIQNAKIFWRVVERAQWQKP